MGLAGQGSVEGSENGPLLQAPRLGRELFERQIEVGLEEERGRVGLGHVPICVAALQHPDTGGLVLQEAEVGEGVVHLVPSCCLGQVVRQLTQPPGVVALPALITTGICPVAEIVRQPPVVVQVLPAAEVLVCRDVAELGVVEGQEGTALRRALCQVGLQVERQP